MKTISMYRGIALLAVTLTIAACQNELNEKTTEPKPGEKINMTIRATQSTGSQTRTSYEDKLGEGFAGNVVVKWEGEDGTTLEKIKLFGYATTDPTEFTGADELSSKPASLCDEGFTIDFEAPVTSAENYLAIYPAENCTFVPDDPDDEESAKYIYFSFLNQTQDCSKGKEMVHLKKYDIMTGQLAENSDNNYIFEHKATMLRFMLNLPKAESVTNVTLTSSDKFAFTTEAFIAVDVDFEFRPTEQVESISLGITNHNASTTLKAYMMTPPCNLTGDELTITVETAGGSTYEGTLSTAGKDLDFINSMCYTLEPTLAPINVITIPSVTEGNLGASLTAKEQDFSDPTMTKLALEGEVNDTDDFSTLVSFLTVNATNITVLDLSGLTNVTEVKKLENCTTIETVILPDEANAIGEKAFKGCTALSTVIQNENENGTAKAQTRASMPKKVKTVGESAFENCTSITEMFLHAGITNVGNNAFKGCSSMKALVFEGDNEVSSITLGSGIIDGTHEDLKILLPTVTGKKVATTYNNKFEKPTYYGFKNDYSKATTTDKVKSELYTLFSNDGSSVENLEPGGEWGE